MPVCRDCGGTENFGAEQIIARNCVLVCAIDCAADGVVQSQSVSVDKIKTVSDVGSRSFYCRVCASENVDWLTPALLWGNFYYAPSKEEAESLWFRQIYDIARQDGSLSPRTLISDNGYKVASGLFEE